MLLPCGLLVGCETTSDNGAPLELIEDYLIWSGIQSDMEPEEVDYEYYGTYGDSVVVFFQSAGAYETPTDERVAGYRFKYPDSRVIRVWNDGKFYKLSEAYEKKLLKGSDIFSIYLKHLFVDVEEPLFIYEEKKYYYPDIEAQSLILSAVSIDIDKSLSREGKKFDEDFFYGIQNLEIIEIHNYFWLDRQNIWIYFEEISPEEMLELFNMLYTVDGICAVYPQYMGHLDYSANDPYYTDTENYGQWALDNIEIEKVWDFTTGTDAVRVGVIDTGIASHEDLDSNYLLKNAWYFNHKIEDYIENKKNDSISHGTHVAGIIGAVGNNGIGISGVNWSVSLVQLGISYGMMLNDTTEKAWKWVRDNMETENRIPIINMSISWDREITDIEALIRQYVAKSGLLVCSIGNEEANSDKIHKYPGFYGSDLYSNKIENIITVGNIDENNNLPSEANWGANTIDIYAPGEYILSTVPCLLCSRYDDFCTLGSETSHATYGYHIYSGSSMSTPYVTGTAALLLSVNPDLTAAQLKECILEGADIIEITTGDGEKQNVRKLNAWGAFKYLMDNYIDSKSTVSYYDIKYTDSIDADASYFCDNTSMRKLTFGESGTTTVTVSADYPFRATFYDSNLNAVKTVSSTNNKVEFEYSVSSGAYYLRVNYLDESKEGTINVNVTSPHTHSYTCHAKYSKTHHIQACACGAEGTVVSPHVVKLGSSSGKLANCMYCGQLINLDDTIVSTPGSNAGKVTPNGSYILPNGIIVLAEEDIEAYENGTLVFYDKDKLPEVA